MIVKNYTYRLNSDYAELETRYNALVEAMKKIKSMRGTILTATNLEARFASADSTRPATK